MAHTLYADIVRRSALPAVMFAADAALALQISEDKAATLMRAGRFGPTFQVGRRLAVLRDQFLARLAAGDERPTEAPAA